MRTMRILSTVACALLALALVASGGQAAPRRHATAHKAGKAHVVAKHASKHAARTTAKPAAKPAATAPGAAGMVVAVDPTDGSLRLPTAEEMQALGATSSLNESADGLMPVQMPGGGAKVDLQGRFQDFAVVRIGKDGRPIFGCSSSPAKAMAETYAPQGANGAVEDK